MGILNSVSIDEIRSRGSIKDGDVLRLARAFHEDHAMTAEEAEALFTLNGACPIKDPAWSGFFVAAITEFIVNQMQPEGYVVAENARWLALKLGADGRIQSHTELELLINVIETARWSPPGLAAQALEQVRHAVVTGAGPLRTGQSLEPGAISQAEIDLLRRIMLALGGEGSLAVTRAEADVLVAINKVVAPGKSSPAWTELYVRGVGYAVLAGLGHVVPPRAEALSSGTWLGVKPDATVIGMPGRAPRGAAPASALRHIGDFVGRMIAGGAGSVWSSCRLQSPEERALTRLERQRLEIITNEPILEADEAWLVGRLNREIRLDDNDQALIAFLKHEASALPQGLSELAARAAIAA